MFDWNFAPTSAEMQLFVARKGCFFLKHLPSLVQGLYEISNREFHFDRAYSHMWKSSDSNIKMTEIFGKLITFEGHNAWCIHSSSFIWVFGIVVSCSFQK